MQIELSEATQEALAKAAAAAGMSVSRYADLLMQEQLTQRTRSAEERLRAVDALIAQIRTARSTLGRNGRRWREFIHEGHTE